MSSGFEKETSSLRYPSTYTIHTLTNTHSHCQLSLSLLLLLSIIALSHYFCLFVFFFFFYSNSIQIKSSRFLGRARGEGGRRAGLLAYLPCFSWFDLLYLLTCNSLHCMPCVHFLVVNRFFVLLVVVEMVVVVVVVLLWLLCIEYNAGVRSEKKSLHMLLLRLRDFFPLDVSDE